MSPGVTAVNRVRRESERSRSDAGTVDGSSVAGQRATTNQAAVRPRTRSEPRL